MSCTTQTITIASPSTRAKELAFGARKLLEDLKGLEAGMIATNDWQQRPRRTSSIPSYSSQGRILLRRTSSSANPFRYQTPYFCEPFFNHSTSATLKDATSKKHVSGEFVTLCEQLLYINHVWKRERQLRALRASVKSLEKAKCSNAFRSFCDRLLLQNRVWQLERRIQELAAEGERDKRARVAAISRAAQQMAVDVRKEAMIEELVLELMQELQESREFMHGMKYEHEREVREIQGDWLKEYRRLARENEQLRLQGHARLAEQQVSNELEQSLSDALDYSRQRIHELEDGDGNSTLVGDAFDQGSVLFSGSSSTADEGEMDELDVDEGLSTVSSGTCVSLPRASDWPKKSANLARRKRPSTATGTWSHDGSINKRRPSRRQSTSLRKLDTTPYAGFSFNPLFFGNSETLVVSPSRPESADTPVKVTLKLASSSGVVSSRQRTDSMAKSLRSLGPAGSKGPWRF